MWSMGKNVVEDLCFREARFLKGERIRLHLWVSRLKFGPVGWASVRFSPFISPAAHVANRLYSAHSCRDPLPVPSQAIMKVVLIIGTRPEAIKMAPVWRALEEQSGIEPFLVSTGQHRELLDDALLSLGLEVDLNLDVMRPDQSLDQLSARILERLPRVLATHSPDALLVQGDTTTAMAATLCAFHHRLPVGHVEAGLRTGNLNAPFPEEGNRQLIDRLSRWCFAPTESAAENLHAEGIERARVFVTGNTGIDSLLWALEQGHGDVSPPASSAGSDFVLMTLHRRESFGAPLEAILNGVADFLVAEPGAQVLWPVHPNPRIADALETLDSSRDGEAGQPLERLVRVAPPSYLTFARWMAESRLLFTDSGGLQEEGPSLGKRVLVARDTTERPEALETSDPKVPGGRNLLVGRRRDAVATALRDAWLEPPYHGPLPAPNPYGDGEAARRIVEILRRPNLSAEP